MRAGVVVAGRGAGGRTTAVFGSCDDAPGAQGIVSGFRNLLHHHVHQQSAGPAKTFWAGLGAVRREAFISAGGFDETRFSRPSIEDIELGMRLVTEGANIDLDPAIQGTHLKRWTLLGMLKTDFAHRGLPWTRLLLCSRSLPRHLNLGWRYRLSAAASLTPLFAVVRRSPAVLAGAVLVLVGLNRSLYALALRRLGPAKVLAGVGVHVLHHLAAAASFVGGFVAHVGGTHKRRRPPHGGTSRSPQWVRVSAASRRS